MAKLELEVTFTSTKWNILFDVAVYLKQYWVLKIIKNKVLYRCNLGKESNIIVKDIISAYLPVK